MRETVQSPPPPCGKAGFQEPTSALVQRYGESVSFDWRLYAQDIRGSIAHACALERAGILKPEERSAIESGLKEIQVDIEAGRFVWKQELEDVHMNIEAELTRLIGAAGAKSTHTARSRNDPGGDRHSRLVLPRGNRCPADGCRIRPNRRLVECAERAGETVMPGYTHLQRGQPVLYAHHLLAWRGDVGARCGSLWRYAPQTECAALGLGRPCRFHHCAGSRTCRRGFEIRFRIAKFHGCRQ